MHVIRTNCLRRLVVKFWTRSLTWVRSLPTTGLWLCCFVA